MLTSPRNLQTSIILGSTLGLLLISTVTALVSLVPFYSGIKKQEEHLFIDAIESGAFLLETELKTLNQKGLSILRQLSQNQDQTLNDKTLDQIRLQSQALLDDTLVGISYLNTKGQIRLAVGQPAPQELHQFIEENSKSESGSQPVVINRKLYWGITDLVENKGEYITILLLFQVPKITEVSAECTDLTMSCHVIIGTDKGDVTLSLLNQKNSDFTQDLLQDAATKIALEKTLQSQTGGIWCKTCNFFLTYSPVPSLNGGLIYAIKKDNLYASIYKQVFKVAGVIAGLILLGTGALVIILRPLIQRINQEILERQKIELALQQERDFAQTLFDANPAFLILLDTDGKIKLINPAMLNAIGYTFDEIVGKDYLATLVIREVDDTLPWVFKLKLNQQKLVQTEEKVLTREGRDIMVEWHGQAVFNPNTHTCEYFLGAGLDITERKRTEEAIQLLQQITRSVSVAANFDSALEVALRLICETTGWEFGEAWVLNPEQTHLEYSAVGYGKNSHFHTLKQFSDQLTLQLNQDLAGRVWLTQKTQWIPDINQELEERFPRKALLLEHGLKAGFGVPILADNQVLAILVFLMSVASSEDKRLVELISSIAVQLGTVFQRKQAEAKYRSIFENALEGIFQVSLEGKYLSANPALAEILGYASPEVLIQRQANIKDIYYNLEDCNRFIQVLQKRGEIFNFEAQVYRQDGRLIWILQNARAIFAERSQRSLYYEGSVINITNLKQTEEQLRYSASHDSLTNLWNRSFFMERLNLSIYKVQEQIGYQFAVLFLDLDGFKLINDSLGHSIGDQLLIEIGKRLRQCIRSNDTLARLGGDEFTVLLENIADVEEVKEIAERVQAALKRPFNLQGHQVFTGASIGIVQSSPEYQLPPEVIRDADTAMYRAKRQGKGCSIVFDATMRTDSIRRLQLQTDLRWALARGEFLLHYQPILELETETIAGFEALLRWHHPQEGLIAPAEFIPVAEEAGLAVEIGEWVLQTACQQLSQWKQKYPLHPSITMSVNLSAQQFTADLGDRIDQILAETQVRGRDLKLEITETAIMTDPKIVIAALKDLKKREVEICIDDFGTGYCSLGYLHQFPIDILKIDCSFVSQMSAGQDQQEIVRVIVALAQSLGISAIAEGIETLEQLQHLRSLNCRYGQGYYFSKALDQEKAEEWLQ
ncbi:MAG: sensor domain-containing protein [Microcoleaceae cyanobacterium]